MLCYRYYLCHSLLLALSNTSNLWFQLLCILKKKLIYFIKLQKGVRIYPSTVPVPNPTVAYRTLPFSVRIFITLAVTLREAYRIFWLEFSCFSLKKSKARTVSFLNLRPINRFDWFISEARTDQRSF